MRLIVCSWDVTSGKLVTACLRQLLFTIRPKTFIYKILFTSVSFTQMTKKISFHTDKREYFVLCCVLLVIDGDHAVTAVAVSTTVI